MMDDFKSLLCIGVIVFFTICESTQLRADSRDEDPKVEITVEPDRLLLGQSQDAVVYARVVDKKGETIPHASIILQANVGSIATSTENRGGEVTAVYVPPDEYYPQWAVITALARLPGKTVHGRYCLPLIGLGKAVVESEPHVSVTLEIGENTFGPVTSNKRGLATFDIFAPPGTRFGKAGGSDVDLKLPEMNRISVIPESHVAIAGSKTGIVLWIHVVDDQGKGLADEKIDISAARGRVSGAKEVVSGLYRAEYFAPRKIDAGKDQISIQLLGHPQSKHTVGIDIVAGIASKLVVQAAPSVFLADREGDIFVETRVFDNQGNPVPAQIEIESSVGTISTPWAIAPGRYGSVLTLPHKLGDIAATKVRVLARVGQTTLRKEHEIPMKPGEPKQILVNSKSLNFDRRSNNERKISLRMEDAFGNKVRDGVIRLTASDGTVPDEITSQNNGDFVFGYLPDSKSGADTVKIVATAYELQATILLHAFGEELLSIIPEVGFITNFSYHHSPYFSVRFNGSLGMLAKGLFASAEGAFYYSHSEEKDFGYKSSLYMVPLTAGLGYRHHLRQRLRIVGRLGIGANVAILKKQQRMAPDIRQRETTFTFNAALGLKYRLGMGEIVTELGYLFARIKSLEETRGLAGGMFISIGYQFVLLHDNR